MDLVPSTTSYSSSKRAQASLTMWDAFNARAGSQHGSGQTSLTGLCPALHLPLAGPANLDDGGRPPGSVCRAEVMSRHRGRTTWH